MIRAAQLLLISPGQLERDCQVFATGLTSISPRIPWAGFYGKKLFRRQVPLAKDVFVGGTVSVVHCALKQLGVPIPEPFDYPECLTEFLHRSVRPSVGREALRCAQEAPIFIKPRGQVKRFTGSVHGGAHSEPSRIRPGDKVWCSTVVTFKSEWRAFVLCGRVAAIQHYWGDDAPVCRGTVEEAARKFFDSGGPAACLLDFGVLDDGGTALVEANDAYACGAYDAPPAVYAAVLITRWIEIVQGRQAALDVAMPKLLIDTPADTLL